MIIAYYQILLVMSVLLTLLYVLTWQKHFDVHITLIFVLVPINILGNLMIAQSETIEAATTANKLTYLGGTFLILTLTLAIFDLCDISLNRTVKTALYALSTVVYLSSLTIGEQTWFYRSYDFAVVNGTGMLINKEYGVMHDVFIAQILILFVLGFAAMVYSYFLKNNVSNKIILLLFIPEVLCLIAFFGGRQFTTQVELLPAAYVIAQITYLVIVRRICLYDVTDTGVDSIEQTGEAGLMSFDFRRNYLGCNETASRIFPVLAEVKIDAPIPPGNEEAEQIKGWLDAFEENESNNRFHYNYQDRIYLITVSYLCVGRRRRGYHFLITDDTESQNYIALLRDFKVRLEEQVEEKTRDIVEMHNKLILGMATMVESRDNSTGGHIRRTSEGVRILTEEIRKAGEQALSSVLTEEDIRNMIKAAPMHDLGKIAVDDAILRKPGRFTAEEFEKMKAHAREGARIVHAILEGTTDDAFHHIAENMAHYHHERWDGSGYPDGLKGEEIPLEARIMAIADVYDALVSKRVYKDSMSFEQADQIIMEGMGKHFDPALEPYYVAARPKLEAYYSAQNAAEVDPGK